MAEGTRLRDLNDRIIDLEEKVQQMGAEYQTQIDGLTIQIKEAKESGYKQYEALQAESTKRHEELLQLLTTQSTTLKTQNLAAQSEQQIPHNSKSGSSNTPWTIREGKGILPTPRKQNEGDEDKSLQWVNRNFYHNQHLHYPKLDFPSFTGEDPKSWVENCKQYFELYQIPQHQWLSIATMHLIGKARTWKQGYFINKQLVSWDEFTEAVCRRFAHIGEMHLIRQCHNLKQIGTVEGYQEKFEELRFQLLYYNPHLTKEHFISCYINGLNEELILFLNIAHPNTLEEAYDQAKLHKRALAVINKKNKIIPKTSEGQYPSHSLTRIQPGVNANRSA